MPKNRERQRDNRRKGKESILNTKNMYGIPDPTPKQAVEQIIRERSRLK